MRSRPTPSTPRCWTAGSQQRPRPARLPLTVGDPVLSALLARAEGSLKAFCLAAGVAIESAADRGATTLDAEALEAGEAASWEEADSE